MQVPLVATNGACHAALARRREICLDVFTCLHHKLTLKTVGQLLTKNAERHLEIRRRRNDADACLQATPDAIANTAEVSAQLPFSSSRISAMNFPAIRYPMASLKSTLRDRTR